MPDPEIAFTLGNLIRTEAGMVAFILFVGDVLLFWMWWMERNDRREAWRSHNQIAKETNDAIHKFSIAVSLLVRKDVS